MLVNHVDSSGSKSSNMPHAPCESGESFQWLVHNMFSSNIVLSLCQLDCFFYLQTMYAWIK